MRSVMSRLEPRLPSADPSSARTSWHRCSIHLSEPSVRMIRKVTLPVSPAACAAHAARLIRVDDPLQERTVREELPRFVPGDTLA